MKNRTLFLSHVLSNETVGYGGKKDFETVRTQSISDGNSCNQSVWKMNNHIGTHIDAPFHFTDKGMSLEQFPAEFWIFNRVHLVEVSVMPSSLIDVNSWCDNIPMETELLLIKTGFEEKRNSSEYWEHNPGLTPGLGEWLRQSRPNLRVVGFDFISLTSYDHRPLGKKAHQSFLGEGSGRPILIVEDMHLMELKDSPKRTYIFPMRVSNADGSPVTIIAEI
jgi:kynurenine formamidase